MAEAYNTCIDYQSLKKSAVNIENQMGSLSSIYGREGTLFIEELKDKLDELELENDDCFDDCFTDISILEDNTKDVTIKINNLLEKIQSVCEIYKKTEGGLESKDKQISLLKEFDNTLGLEGLDSLAGKDYEMVLTNNKEILKDNMSITSRLNLIGQLEKISSATVVRGSEGINTNAYIANAAMSSGVTTGYKKTGLSNDGIFNLRANAASITNADLEEIVPIALGIGAGSIVAIGGTKHIKNSEKRRLENKMVDENYQVEETNLLKDSQEVENNDHDEEYIDYGDADLLEDESSLPSPMPEQAEVTTSKKRFKYKIGKVNQLQLEDNKR